MTMVRKVGMLARLVLPLALFGSHQGVLAQNEQQASASATVESRAADVVAFFNGDIAAEEIFSPSFLAAVPPAQLSAVVAQTTGQFGAAIGVEEVTSTGPASAKLALRFDKAIVSGPMSLDASGMIANLLLNEIAPVDDSPAKIIGELKALPGQTNAWFGPLEGGAPLLTHKADTPLALGSTFKLYVLSALSRAVERGEHRWDEVVRLDARSFPSGVTQDWPEDAPVTIQTLATLMVQISDNTATDHMIRLLGREAVEAELAASSDHAALNMPLLTTRELFVLKSDPALRQAWLAADEAARRAMLADLANREIDLQSVLGALSGSPTAIEQIEWFASPGDLGALMLRLTGPEHATARAIMAASPGLGEAPQNDWAYVGYKGGSEPGVLNLTWLLRDKGGRWHMLTLGWNNSEATVETSTLELLALRILALSDGASPD